MNISGEDKNLKSQYIKFWTEKCTKKYKILNYSDYNFITLLVSVQSHIMYNLILQ